jgi:hypothetical protein
MTIIPILYISIDSLKYIWGNRDIGRQNTSPYEALLRFGGKPNVNRLLQIHGKVHFYCFGTGAVGRQWVKLFQKAIMSI